MIAILYMALAILSCFVTHEAGHFIFALLFGYKIEFRFSIGWIGYIPIPRYVWDMPKELNGKKRKLVAISGFALEFFCAFLSLIFCQRFGVFMGIFALMHFMIYPLYAGGENDFQWL